LEESKELELVSSFSLELDAVVLFLTLHFVDPDLELLLPALGCGYLLSTLLSVCSLHAAVKFVLILSHTDFGIIFTYQTHNGILNIIWVQFGIEFGIKGISKLLFFF